VTVIRPPALSLSGLYQEAKKFFRYADLLYTLSVHRVKVRYKQSVLGVAWALLQPLALMLIYTFIFAYVARVDTGATPYALFAFAGLLPWTCFATAVTNATNSLVSHANLVTKVYFPREILPFTYVIAALFDLVIASSMMLMLMVYYGVPIRPSILYTVPIVAILAIFSTAVSLIFSATQVRFRDIGVAMPLLLQIWMFATPVVYPLSAVPQRLRPFYSINPLVGLIENYRQVVISGGAPSFSLLALAAAVSIVLFAVGYVYFKRVEATVADII
jgi:lipopolysaccharide transport system permease protein